MRGAFATPVPSALIIWPTCIPYVMKISLNYIHFLAIFWFNFYLLLHSVHSVQSFRLGVSAIVLASFQTHWIFIGSKFDIHHIYFYKLVVNLLGSMLGNLFSANNPKKNSLIQKGVLKRKPLEQREFPFVYLCSCLSNTLYTIKCSLYIIYI